MSTPDSGRKVKEDSENGKLFHEIEAISKALYLDKKSPKGKLNTRSASIGGEASFPLSKMKSKNVNLDDEVKDKKSFWNWKPLKALSHIRNKRFNCCFSLVVHSIEDLPSEFNSASVRVHWKRRDGEVATECVKVIDGVAEFDQKLTHTCSVYGSRSGQHHSVKYEAKHFLLYATLFGSSELDLGKHRVDLTRLLPLTLEELEEEKSSGSWTTNFKLSGKAKGATLHVSFGYSVLKDNLTPPVNKKFAPGTISKQSSTSIARYGSNSKVSHNTGGPSVRRSGSLPSNSERWPLGSSNSEEDIKVMHEVLTNSSSEIPSLIKKTYDEVDKKNLETSVDKPEFDVFTVNLPPLDHSARMPDMDDKIVEKEGKKNDIFVSQQVLELLGEEPDMNVNIVEDVSLIEASDIEDGIEKNELSAQEHGNKSLGMDPDENVNKAEDITIVERGKDKMKKEYENTEMSLAEQGTELLSGEPDDIVNILEDIKIVSESAIGEANVEHGASPTKMPLEEPVELECLDKVFSNQLDRHLALDDDIKDDSKSSKTDILKELQSALDIVSSLELAGFDSPEGDSQADDSFIEDPNRKSTSISFDDETDSVACEFLNLLGMESGSNGLSSEGEPESPRERLLRQFEKDALADGFPLFDYSCFEEDTIPEDCSFSETDLDHEQDDIDLSSIFLAAEEEYLAAIESEASKTKAKMLEDLETEDLMREWGLDENAFDHSPSPIPSGIGGFNYLLDDPSELPTLGEGLGPLIQTKDGGYIRSMSPSAFGDHKCGGSLIMQVSSPVVVPAEMGSDVMGILQGLASVGIEKLSMQAKKLMPLEDISGKMLQQIAWEASSNKEATESQSVHQHEKAVSELIYTAPRRVKPQSYKPSHGNVNTSLSGKDMQSVVSLEDLAPLAMNKIEALAMEGLRIQAGMSTEDAPANISAQSMGDFSALKGNSVDHSGSLGIEGTAGLQLVDVKDSSKDVDGLMSLSLRLDEWMRLDSGDFDDDGDDQISERTSKILAAHHANSSELIRRGSKGDKKRGKGSSKKCGLLGNNFTVALLVQLRDPLRNYEPVGTSMLALIQVERMFLPPKPRIFRTVSQVGSSEEDDEIQAVGNVATKETKEGKSGEEEGVSQYRIKEVHVAGLKVDSAKNKLLGSKTHQQSGSRWLVANGMGKPNKHPLLKSKAVVSKPNAPGPAAANDSLWSISSLFWGRGSKRNESPDANSLKRNPDIVFETKAVKLG